jgi:membrane protease YdiL (CAAX protease family)
VLEGAAAGAVLYAVLRRALAPAATVANPARSLAFRGLAVTVVAWAEETLWRGVLLGVLAARSAVFALVLSTAGFAAAHVYGQGWTALRTHALTGVTFGALYVVTGSLAAAIVAHAVYNLFVVADDGARRKRRAAALKGATS